MSKEIFDVCTSGEFGTAQVEALLAAQPVALDASHAVFRCLTRAITHQAVQMKAIGLLAQLSRVPANREACFRCLMSVGGTLEHLLLKADPAADPAIHVAVLCLLANVGEYKLDASQVLELYNGNVGMSVKALCALLFDTHSKTPLSSLISAAVPSKLSWTDAADQISAAIRCMYELSTWKHFKSSLRAHSETDVPMVKLQGDFIQHIISINQAITQPFSAAANSPLDSSVLSDGVEGLGSSSSMFPVITAVFEEWLELANCLPQESEADAEKVRSLLAVLEAALSNTVLLIVNMLSFTNEFSAKFRTHVAVKSGGFVEKVLLPMLLLELDILEGKRNNNKAIASTTAARPAVMLQLLLKVIALLGFKTKVFRPALRAVKFLVARLITNPVMMDSTSKVEFFALVVRFMVNTEQDDSVSHVLEAHRALTDRQRLLVALRLSNPAEKLYPINVFCQTYQSLKPIFFIDPVAAAAVNEQVNVPSASGPKFNFTLVPTNSRTDAPEVFSSAGAFNSPQTTTHKRCTKRRAGGVSISEKLAMRREAQRRRKKIILRKKQSVPTAAVPIQDDDEVWEDMGDDEGSDGDVSSTFRKVGDVDEGEELEDFSGVREAVVISAGSGGGGGKVVSLFDEGSDDEDGGADGPSPSSPSQQGSSPTIPVDESASVLYAARSAQAAQQRGDALSSGTPADVVRLTGKSSTQKATSSAAGVDESSSSVAVVVSGQTGPFDLTSYRRVAPPLGCPDQYLCALTRRIMSVPVISPSGDVFDKESILGFLKDTAHRNRHPFTGEPLYGRDLVVDTQLRRELDVVRGNYFSN